MVERPARKPTLARLPLKGLFVVHLRTVRGAAPLKLNGEVVTVEVEAISAPFTVRREQWGTLGFPRKRTLSGLFP